MSSNFHFPFFGIRVIRICSKWTLDFCLELHPSFHLRIYSKNFLLKSNLSRKIIFDIVLSLSIRKLIHWIVTKKLFDNFIMLVILVNILNILNIMNIANIRNTMLIILANIRNIMNIRNTTVVIMVSILNIIINRNTMLVILVKIPFPWNILQNIFCFLYQVSSVSLASEDPVDEDSVRNYYLGIADYFFTGLKFEIWH